MKNQGISIMGIIVFIGLIALIGWGLNYIVTKDYATVSTPTTIANNTFSQTTATATTSIALNGSPATTSTATSTTQATKTKTVTATPAKPVTTPPQTDTNTDTSSIVTTNSSLTVILTNQGFSPARLVVSKGQTVTFVNNSSGKMWVAANPFPTSSEYPAFNEKTGIANGSSWSFTFEQVGTWFYHNHYSPATGAKIVVSP